MLRRHACITDQTAKAWWKDFQGVLKEGNPLGLSFVEYVAQRVLANFTPTYTEAPQSPWYVSSCGHKHQWGAACEGATA